MQAMAFSNSEAGICKVAGGDEPPPRGCTTMLLQPRIRHVAVTIIRMNLFLISTQAVL